MAPGALSNRGSSRRQTDSLWPGATAQAACAICEAAAIRQKLSGAFLR